ncbi:MAG: hypothetical protein ACREYE_04760 [Gammaproteobacteria bacterium]
MEQIKPGSTLPRGKKEGGLTVKLFKGHYTSSSLYFCARDLVARAWRNSSLTSAARPLLCCAAMALSRLRRSPSMVKVVLFIHHDVL